MNTEKINEQFNLIAKEYDADRRKFIPCFDDYYITSTELISAKIASPKSVLDLGTGTGLLTMFWYEHFPDAEYTLVDIAEDMLSIAKKRFENCGNVKYLLDDYSKALPDGEFDAVISALSVHHLSDENKLELFGRIYDKLPKGGVFVNYDQFCAGKKELDTWFDSYWENQIRKSGIDETGIERWRERRKLDRECSVENEVRMLEKCGFSAVKCVYAYHKFAVIMGIK